MKIEQVKDNTGKSVSLAGWVYRAREGKGLVFIVLRDSTGIVQCVAKEGSACFMEARKAGREASVKLSGKVREDKRAPTGYEIDIEKLEIVGPSDNFPITKDQSTEFLLDMRHLWVRSRRLTSIFKVRSEVLWAIHSFFRSRDFFEIQSPSITSSACEGGSTLFEVDYFGSKAYLTQSWQLYAEALIASLESIYCIAPSFRAERSRTRRHLAEYWHAEAEVAWMDHEENMKLQEGLVSHVVETVAKKRKSELELIGRDVNVLLKMTKPYKRIRYEEALEILKADGVKLEWGADFGADEERQLTTHFDRPFFVTEFPKEAKAFYMLENPANRKTVLCDDMLAPEGYGEIIGGSERETDNKKLIENIKAQNGNPADYKWYLDLREYGSVPHSGFGLGVERLVMWLCKLDHIRDAIAFPRVMNRSYP